MTGYFRAPNVAPAQHYHKTKYHQDKPVNTKKQAEKQTESQGAFLEKSQISDHKPVSCC